MPTLALALCAAAPLSAATWDPDAVTPEVQGGSGNWDLTSPNWNRWPDPNVVYTVGEGVYFAGAGGTVLLTQPFSVPTFDVKSAYTFVGQKLTANAAIGIEADTWVFSSFHYASANILGGKTLRLSGGLDMTPGANQLGQVFWSNVNYNGILALLGGYWTTAGSGAIYNNTIVHSGGTVGFTGTMVIGSGVLQYSDLGQQYNISKPATWEMTTSAARLEPKETTSFSLRDIVVGEKGANAWLKVDEGTVDVQAMTVGTGSFTVTSFLSETGSQYFIRSEGKLTVAGDSIVSIANTLGIAAGGAAKGTVDISENGVLSVGKIDFGLSRFVLAGQVNEGFLTLRDGHLYVGSGGIVNSSTGIKVTDSITISGGTVGATANWSSSLNMALEATKTDIVFQAADAEGVAHNITLTGALSGSGAIYKTGLGTLTLGGANSYAGETRIEAGRLALTGATNNIASSPTITVQSGTTFDVSGVTSFELAAGQVLRGSGTVVGSVAAGAGTILAPGNSPGTLSMENLSLNDGAVFRYEIGLVGGQVESDLIQGSGQLSLGTWTLFVESDAEIDLVGGNFAVFDFSEVSGASFGNVTITFADSRWSGGQLSFDQAGRVMLGGIQGSAIPEPGTGALLIGLGAFAWAGTRRSRRITRLRAA